MTTSFASSTAVPAAPFDLAIQLGAIQVRPALGYLRHADDREAHLEPRVMDLLVYMSARPGEVLTKEALREGVWRGRFVTHDALFVAISALRRALGDEPRAARFVATVPKRGYRWVGPPAETVPLGPEVASAPAASATADPLPSKPVPSKPTGPANDVAHEATGRETAAPAHRSSPARRWRLAVGISGGSILAVLGLWGSFAHRDGGGRSPSARALSAVAEGRHFARQGSSESLRRAVGAYSEAIALAPRLAPAFAGLADTYAQMVDRGFGTARDLGQAARANAARAVELDPDASSSHMAIGSVRMLFDRDLQGAATSYRRALEIDPKSTDALERLAWAYSARGAHEAAENASRRALAIDPTSSAIHANLLTILYFARQAEALATAAESALRVDQELCVAHFLLSHAHRWRGQDDRAFVALRQGLFCAQLDAAALAEVDQAFETEGLAAVNRWTLAHAAMLVAPESLRLAAIAAVAGEGDRALDLLEQAEHRTDPALLWVDTDPAFDSVRSHERYRRLMRRLADATPAG